MTLTAPHEASKGVQRRQVTSKLQLRQTSSSTAKTLEFEGYACVTEETYDVGWWMEVVRSGAFTRTLKADPDVRLLINHDGLPLARTKSGTLQLSEDTTGLLCKASFDPLSPLVAEIQSPIEREDLDAMSFAFWVRMAQWSPDYDERAITDVELDGGDVSIVTYPANPATAGIGLRSGGNLPSLEELAEDELRAMQARCGRLLLERAAPTAPAAGGMSVDEVRRSRRLLRL